MGAKDEVDRIMPQQVAGQADTQPQSAKLPCKVLRRVQQRICMNISGRRDQADVDCGQAGHGTGSDSMVGIPSNVAGVPWGRSSEQEGSFGPVQGQACRVST